MHRKHAAKIEAQQRIVKFGQPLAVEPTEALLGVLHLSAGHLAWIRSELDDDTLATSSFERDVLMRMWDEERDRIARISKAALEAGVAERRIKLAESYGEQLANVLRAIFYDDELALTGKQRDRLPELLRRHLATFESDQPALVAGA